MTKKFQSIETQILFSLVQTLYGSKVSEGELVEIQNQVEAIMESIETMRSIPLNNVDEPALRFTPYRRTE
jgi:Asp-tRNA(Asn)/Glu-tRNA(Gln) amidotransferase C subunit